MGCEQARAAAASKHCAAAGTSACATIPKKRASATGSSSGTKNSPSARTATKACAGTKPTATQRTGYTEGKRKEIIVLISDSFKRVMTVSSLFSFEAIND
jgi:hypothetical protein